MFTDFEKTVRIEALKYYINGGESGSTIEENNTIVNAFLDADEPTQKSYVMSYIINRSIPFYEGNLITSQAGTDAVQLKLTELIDYRDNN